MSTTQIHPTAVVADGAQLGADVIVGPYCVVGEHVKLGDRARLDSHVVVDGHTTVGADCQIFPFACIGKRSQDLKFKGGITHVEIGTGTTLREYVTVHSGTAEGQKTVVGAHCFILAYCHIAHDCVLSDHVIMSSFAALAGHVHVEDRAIIGGFAAVHQFVRIGRMAMVGATSALNQDAPPFMLTEGRPGKPLTINKVGLQRNGVSLEIQTQLRQAHKILFSKRANLAEAIELARKQIPSSSELEHLLKFCETTERGIALPRADGPKDR